MIYTANKIKKMFDIILDNGINEYDLSSDNASISGLIQNKFFSIDFKNSISDFKNILMEDSKSSKIKINNLSLKEIITRFNNITQDNIMFSDNSDIDSHKSFITRNRNSDTRQHIRDYIELKRFYTAKNMLEYFIPDEGDITSTYISFNEQINIIMQYISNNFTLLRIKSSNKFIFNIDYTTIVDGRNNNRDFVMNIPVDMIDISISTKNDYNEFIKSMIYQQFGHKPQYSVYSTVVEHKGDNYQFEYILQSRYLMIIDLQFILFYQPLFPWNENKYEKRIERLMYIYLYNYLHDRIPHANILYDVNELTNILHTLHGGNIEAQFTQLKGLIAINGIKKITLKNTIPIYLIDDIFYGKYFGVILISYIRSVILLLYVEDKAKVPRKYWDTIENWMESNNNYDQIKEKYPSVILRIDNMDKVKKDNPNNIKELNNYRINIINQLQSIKKIVETLHREGSDIILDNYISF